MPRHTPPVLLLLLLVATLLPVPVATSAGASSEQPQVAGRVADERGVSGYVLAPDGTPVSTGSVAFLPWRETTTASIDRMGRFRIEADGAGRRQLVVSAPGFAPYRLSIDVPTSRTLKLPVIRLSPATYYRARFVTASGEPIVSPRLRRLPQDASGVPIAEPLDNRSQEQIDSDGTITIGPLPPGTTMHALDLPLLAQTRLPDLVVTGANTLLDGGTVVIQPGAALHVEVVDASGAPVPRHEVWLEDVRLPSPLTFRPVRTNTEGRATFDRLAAGSYRVRTRALGRCNNQAQEQVIAPVVSLPGSGTLGTRLVVGGNATFRLSPAMGLSVIMYVQASPEAGQSSASDLLRGQFLYPPAGRVPPLSMFGTTCTGTVDKNGLVTLENFPPGPTRVTVRLLNSTYVRRVSVPIGGGELKIVIPGGFLPVRVTSARTNGPVAGAAITWTGGGARVEATTTGNGEALLEAVGTTAGTLMVEARGFQKAEGKLSEPPGTLLEVALQPEPDTNVRARVVTSSGAPLADAVVQLSSNSPIHVPQVALTNSTGQITFSDVPSGMFQLMATADGYAPTVMRLSDDKRTDIVVMLSRGYRAIAGVEWPSEMGPHAVRVVNEKGESMDSLLDLASDRRVEPPGRLSLGPLPPGHYSVELYLDGESRPQPRRERIQIIDRDVLVTFR